MSKLMCVGLDYSWKVEEPVACVREVEVIKETAKQYSINGFYRSRINKSELLTDVGYSYPKVFCLEEDVPKAIELIENTLTQVIKNYEEVIKNKRVSLSKIQELKSQYTGE